MRPFAKGGRRDVGRVRLTKHHDDNAAALFLRSMASCTSARSPAPTTNGCLSKSVAFGRCECAGEGERGGFHENAFHTSSATVVRESVTVRNETRPAVRATSRKRQKDTPMNRRQTSDGSFCRHCSTKLRKFSENWSPFSRGAGCVGISDRARKGGR